MHQENAEERVRSHVTELLKSAELNNHIYFNKELGKLDYCRVENLKNSPDLDLTKIDKEIRSHDSKSKSMVCLQEKLELQKQRFVLEKHWRKKWCKFYNSQDKIDKWGVICLPKIEK